MGKPVQRVKISTIDERSAVVEAVFDTGSFITIVRESALPKDAPVLRYPEEKTRKLRIVGETYLVIEIDGHPISVMASVSPDLSRELLIGAGAMQSWDVSIRNENGHTRVEVGHDLRDPGIHEVV